jgi:outer membrane protein insertion porin family/translocation and assembly module TamA
MSRGVRRRLLALALAAIGMSWSARADEAAQPVVVGLEWEGVDHVSRREVARAILTRGPDWRFWKPKPPFDEFALEEDLARVAAFYRDHGFFEASARSELEWNEARSEVRIRIVVEEGAPTTLVAVRVELLTDPARITPEAWEEIRSGLPLRIGRAFGADDYKQARRELLRRLANAGHPAPVLEGGAEIDLATLEAVVDWRVDPGARVRFGPIRVDGLERVEERIVRRELAFAPGDVYSLDAQRESQEKLFALGLFRAVALEPDRFAEEDPEAPERVWPMRVRIDERPPRSLRVGVGYGTEEFIRARVNWRHRNFLGDARMLDLRLGYNSLVSGLDVRLTQPHFLHPKIQLVSDSFLHYETVPAYDAIRASVGFDLIRTLTPAWTARGGYAFELANVFDARNPIQEEGETRIGTIRLGLRRATLDDVLEPSRGTWLDFGFDPSLRAVGSSEDFLTLTAEGRSFLSLWFAVLAMRLRIGAIQPVRGTGQLDIPVFKRFYSGGSTSVRGFEYQKLGPLDANGDPVGGLSLAEASIELRFPIWKQLRGVAFVDAGLVDLEPFTYPLDEILYSAGPGLRLRTPVGSLRLDVGFPLNRPADASAFQVHFSVGHMF